ncbi:insulin receptor substrate 1 [Anolis carolinensis]|uniref:insulin receptor substrate 1 n=1 Tax=Anolis carolinensis TaxID=28377 RepID=UPI002F2B43F3
MEASDSDVRLCGYLRKQKSHRRRFFVLRCASDRGPARLEYYESEKKFRAQPPRPKRAIPLSSALNVNKREDARHRHLVVLYGRQGTFGVAAESPEEQQAWYAAMVELRNKGLGSPGGSPSDACSAPCPPSFSEVWQVSLRPRGLGHSRHLAGSYLLCLAERTVSFLRLNPPEAEAGSAAGSTGSAAGSGPSLVLQLLSVRRCGHSENYFFLEVGRSAATGPGELWMQVEDAVEAQKMHETILEAMKALSDEVRMRSSTASTPGPKALTSSPISVPPRTSKAGQGSPSVGPNVAPALLTRKPGSLSSDYSAVSSDEGGSSPCEAQPPRTPDPLAGVDYIAMAKRRDTHGQWGARSESNAQDPLSDLDYIAMGKPDVGSGQRLVRSVSENCKRNPLSDLDYTAMRKADVGSGQRFKVQWAQSGSEHNMRDPLSELDYIAMARLTASNGHHMTRWASGSKRASLPPLAFEKGTPNLPRRNTAPSATASASYPEGLNVYGYMAMLPGGVTAAEDYVPMTPGSLSPMQENSGGYMVMTPKGSCSPDGTGPWGKVAGGDYVNMSPSGPPFYSLPRSYRPCPFVPSRFSGSSSTSSESLDGGPLAGPFTDPPQNAGEYVSIEYPAGSVASYVTMDPESKGGHGNRPRGPSRWSRGGPERSGAPLAQPSDEAGMDLNYIDLDLVKEAVGAGPAEEEEEEAAPGHLLLHAYASIDFHRCGGFRGSRDTKSPEKDS